VQYKGLLAVRESFGQLAGRVNVRVVSYASISAGNFRNAGIWHKVSMPE